MLSGHQRITWRRNIAENFNRLSRVHERYRRQTTDRQTDRQTDGRRHIANVNMSSRSLKTTEIIVVPNFTKNVSWTRKSAFKLEVIHIQSPNPDSKLNRTHLILFDTVIHGTKNNTKISQQNHLLSAYLVWNWRTPKIVRSQSAAKWISSDGLFPWNLRGK